MGLVPHRVLRLAAMTDPGGQAAVRLGRSGMIEPGMRADVVLLDPDTVRDRSPYEQPDLLADGIDLVAVNGAITVEAQTPSGALDRHLLGRQPQ
jgi:N-acyl-D-aspartate/D-glutamate deacylase